MIVGGSSFAPLRGVVLLSWPQNHQRHDTGEETSAISSLEKDDNNNKTRVSGDGDGGGGGGGRRDTNHHHYGTMDHSTTTTRLLLLLQSTESVGGDELAGNQLTTDIVFFLISTLDAHPTERDGLS